MKQFSEHEVIPDEACNVVIIMERINGIKHALVKNTLPVLVVEATSKCNLSCDFCGMHSKNISAYSQSIRRKNGKEKNHLGYERCLA